MFMHADMGHLFFNMFGLYMFGPPIEMVWGPRKFLLYYFVTGFGALALHFLVKYIDLNYLGECRFGQYPHSRGFGSIFRRPDRIRGPVPNQRILLLIRPFPSRPDCW